LMQRADHQPHGQHSAHQVASQHVDSHSGASHDLPSEDAPSPSAAGHEPALEVPAGACCDGGYCSQNACMSPTVAADFTYSLPEKMAALGAQSRALRVPHRSTDSPYRPPSA
jgi:hypothetical protein